MAGKARLSIEWLSSCSGCELGIVDLHEKLLTVLAEVDLVRCPILMDTKDYVPAEVGLITGSVRTEHDVEAAKKMRAACNTLIAFGTCPVYGGPQGAAYPHSSAELLETAFRRNPTTQTTAMPANVPKMLDRCYPLDAVVPIDIYIPGCPPHAAYIFEGLTALLRGRTPKIGRHNVCYNCNRRMEKSDVDQLARGYQGPFDSQVCFLSQGCICLGSVTLDRCMAPCPQYGVPCFSCGGPSETIILEPHKDVRTMLAQRMSRVTKIPYQTIVTAVERQAKTHYAYAMASPVFREKPTFLIKKWIQSNGE